MADANRKRLALGQSSPSSSQKGSKRRVSNVENIVASSMPLRPAPRSRNDMFGPEQSTVHPVSERRSTALGTGLPSAACPMEDVFEARKHSRPVFGSNENLDPNIRSLASPQQNYVLQSTSRGAATPAPRRMSSSNTSDMSSDVMREGLSTSSFAESKIDLTKTEDTPTSEKSVYKKIKIEG